MGRCHKIYVVATLAHKAYHHGTQLFHRKLIPFPEMTYIIILAEEALEVAVCQKYCPAAIITHQRPLLSEVGMKTGNHGEASDPANPFFALKAFETAVSWTDMTIFRNPIKDSYPFVEFDVGWLEKHSKDSQKSRVISQEQQPVTPHS